MTPSFGIKVSEPGFDVKTAADKNLSLKTGFSMLNVFMEGSLTVDSSPEVIAHNLGYQPQFLVWVLESGGIKDAGAGLATGFDTFATAFVDNNNLNIFAGIGETIKYYIFYEPLTTGTAPTYTPTNNYGIKISKDGVDVRSATLLQQTFNSEKNSIKIALTAQDSHVVNTSYNFLITHGLSTTPGYLLFFEVDGSGTWWSENEQDTLSGKNVLVESFTNGTFLVVSCTSSSSCTVKIRYYILADPAI